MEWRASPLHRYTVVLTESNRPAETYAMMVRILMCTCLEWWYWVGSNILWRPKDTIDSAHLVCTWRAYSWARSQTSLSLNSYINLIWFCRYLSVMSYILFPVCNARHPYEAITSALEAITPRSHLTARLPLWDICNGPDSHQSDFDALIIQHLISLKAQISLIKRILTRGKFSDDIS